MHRVLMCILAGWTTSLTHFRVPVLSDLTLSEGDTPDFLHCSVPFVPNTSSVTAPHICPLFVLPSCLCPCYALCLGDPSQSFVHPRLPRPLLHWEAFPLSSKAQSPHSSPGEYPKSARHCYSPGSLTSLSLHLPELGSTLSLLVIFRSQEWAGA